MILSIYMHTHQRNYPEKQEEIVPLAPCKQQSTPEILYHDCFDKIYYTTDSTYESNLDHRLTSIYPNTEIDYGFYNFSYGEGTDKVSAIALCKPDITPETCRACIGNSTDALTTLCPNFKEAIGGYDDCMLRYTNRSIFNLMEGKPNFVVYTQNNVSDVTGSDRALRSLLGKLRDKAAAGDSCHKYAAGHIDAPDSQMIYALVQCTPDLSQSQCRDCLYDASRLIQPCCSAGVGVRIIFPSCNFRYQNGLFYDIELEKSTPPPPPVLSTLPVTPANTATSKPRNSITVARTIIACALAMLLF